jgi:hypothetical protein
MRHWLLAVLLVLVLSGSALAQDIVTWGVYGGADIRALFFDLRPLNDFLDEAGVKDFTSTVPALGLSLHGVLDSRYHFGIEGSAFTVTKPGHWADAQFTGAFSSLAFGYDAIAQPQFRLRPEIGLGFAVLSLNLDGITGRFHDIEIPDELNRLEFQRTAVAGKLALNIEWTPTFFRNANGLFGQSYTLSVGLYAPLAGDDWETIATGPGPDQDVHGADPDVDFLCGFAALSVRLGGGVTKK